MMSLFPEKNTHPTNTVSFYVIPLFIVCYVFLPLETVFFWIPPLFFWAVFLIGCCESIVRVLLGYSIIFGVLGIILHCIPCLFLTCGVSGSQPWFHSFRRDFLHYMILGCLCLLVFVIRGVWPYEIPFPLFCLLYFVVVPWYASRRKCINDSMTIPWSVTRHDQ